MALNYVHHSTGAGTPSTVSATLEDVTGGTISGASLSASTKYMVLYRFNSTTTNNATLQTFQLYSADDADLATYSEMHFETGSSPERVFSGLTTFTTAATPTDVKAQFSVSDGASTWTIRGLEIMLIDLTSLAAGEYYESRTDTISLEFTTSFPGRVLNQIAGADLGIDEEWLVFGGVNHLDSQQPYYSGITLGTCYDSDTEDNNTEMRTQGDDIVNDPNYVLVGYHRTATAERDVTLYGYETSNNMNAYANHSHLIAIKASVFYQTTWDHDVPATQYSEVETTINTISSVEMVGDQWIIAQTNQNTATGFVSCHIEADGTPLNSVNVDRRQVPGNGNTDHDTTFSMGIYTGEGTPSITHQARVLSATSTADGDFATMVVIAMDSAPAGGGGGANSGIGVAGQPLETG